MDKKTLKDILGKEVSFLLDARAIYLAYDGSYTAGSVWAEGVLSANQEENSNYLRFDTVTYAAWDKPTFKDVLINEKYIIGIGPKQ